MTLYKATVEYDVTNSGGEKVGAFSDEFFASADNEQYVKEQYHRFTHQNYIDVNRRQENDHIHPVGSGEVAHTLVEIQAVDYINGLTPLSRV